MFILAVNLNDAINLMILNIMTHPNGLWWGDIDNQNLNAREIMRFEHLAMQIGGNCKFREQRDQECPV